MSQGDLSPCKTCGEEISRNLAHKRKTSQLFHARCPKCGERDPHGFVAENRAAAEQGCNRAIRGFLAVFVIVMAMGWLVSIGVCG